MKETKKRPVPVKYPGQVLVRFSAETKRRLQEIAEIEGRSLGNLVRFLTEAALKTWKEPKT